MHFDKYFFLSDEKKSFTGTSPADSFLLMSGLPFVLSVISGNSWSFSISAGIWISSGFVTGSMIPLTVSD